MVSVHLLRLCFEQANSTLFRNLKSSVTGARSTIHASWGLERPSAESSYSRVLQRAQRWGLPSEALASLHPFISPQENAINQRGQNQYRKNTPGGKSRPAKEEGGGWDVAPCPLPPYWCWYWGWWWAPADALGARRQEAKQYFWSSILRDHKVPPHNVLTWPDYAISQ